MDNKTPNIVCEFSKPLAVICWIRFVRLQGEVFGQAPKQELTHKVLCFVILTCVGYECGALGVVVTQILVHVSSKNMCL